MRNYFLFFLLNFSIAFSQSPLIQWQLYSNNTYPGNRPQKIISTNDNGYLVLSSKMMINSITNCNLVKLDNNGNVIWERSIGGSSNDDAVDIKQTNDGGYILIASTQSNDGDVSGHNGLPFGSNAQDVWVVKLNNLGLIQWQKCYGGTSADLGRTIIQTTDGGYIFASDSESINGDLNGLSCGGNNDYWVVKIDTIGTIEWQKCFGGTLYDYPIEIIQTLDGGYIVAGHSNSTNGYITSNHGNYDFWVIKINNLGTLEWQKSFGGFNMDLVTGIVQTLDGGYIVGGGTSGNSGDFATGGAWRFIKLNNLGNIIWNKSLPGLLHTQFSQMKINPSNGNILVIGSDYTYSYHNIEIDRLDQNGNLILKNTFGGTAEDFGTSLDFTTDNGLIILCDARSINGDIISVDPSNYHKTWIAKMSPQILSTENFIYSNIVNVYPNPFKDLLHISLSNFDASKIEIYDNLGRLVFNELYNNEINLSRLKSGIYFVNLTNKNGEVIIKKIFKE
ncbi:T9SS type A sorting domain-containing protein [Flavobacterium koreense]